MLKTCWDCIAGTANREPGENGNSYGMRLNGNSQGPFPNSRPLGTMFHLARDLNPRDVVNVTVTVDNLNYYELNVRLMTKNLKQACHLEAKNNGADDKLTVNGRELEDIQSTHVVTENTFTVSFKIQDYNEMDIEIGQVALLTERLRLDHSLQEIGFLTVDGVSKVNSLAFEFDKE